MLVVVVAGIFLFKNRIFPSQTASAATTSGTTTTTSATTSATNAGFFTENFSSGLANWTQFITSGNAADEMSAKASNGSLLFDLPGSDQEELYEYYSPQTYGNVQIAFSTENTNQNVANVYIVCRYNEGAGWYEFNIASNGFYQILYTSWNNGQKGASSAVIADGATNKILTGKNVNQYSASCNDRTLSLTVNGVQVRSVIDNRYVLGDGNIAVGVGSLKGGPVQVKIDPITISQP